MHTHYCQNAGFWFDERLADYFLYTEMFRERGEPDSVLCLFGWRIPAPDDEVEKLRGLQKALAILEGRFSDIH